jgi:hypothetical protein
MNKIPATNIFFPDSSLPKHICISKVFQEGFVVFEMGNKITSPSNPGKFPHTIQVLETQFEQ